ncbi:hypothetical protein BB934_03595 [Microvirga ossetica]|uniref:Sugar ABC transporter substrate-binding protein n=1 Tax=Microvirga ossetica TaxID=1882682 RepID=A0A1B2EBP5_9HYPH|nr:hypothetical protein BB934_03595 [Microvirga ossetica]
MSATAATATTVDFWSPFTGPDGTAIDQLVKQFNETDGKKADVEIKLLIIPWEQYYTKLSVAMAARKAPALAVVHAHRIAGLAKQGALEALTPAEVKEAGLEEADYIPAVFSAGMVNGKRYGVPIDAFPRNLYYNKALFKQAGIDPNAPLGTLDDVMAAARKVRALGEDTYGIFFRLSGAPTARDFYSIYWQFDDKLLSADGKDVDPGFDAAATKAMNIMKGFLDEKLASSNDVQQYDRLFAQNKIGIVMSQITDLAQFEATPGLEFGVVPMPKFGTRQVTFALGHNFVVPRGTNSEQRKAGFVFTKWVSENAIAWAKTGKVPAKISVIKSPDFQKLTAQSAVAIPEMMQFPPSIVAQPDIDRVVQENLEALYGNRLTPKDAASAMAAAIRKELAKQ